MVQKLTSYNIVLHIITKRLGLCMPNNYDIYIYICAIYITRCITLTTYMYDIHCMHTYYTHCNTKHYQIVFILIIDIAFWLVLNIHKINRNAYPIGGLCSVYTCVYTHTYMYKISIDVCIQYSCMACNIIIDINKCSLHR